MNPTVNITSAPVGRLADWFGFDPALLALVSDGPIDDRREVDPPPDVAGLKRLFEAPLVEMHVELDSASVRERSLALLRPEGAVLVRRGLDDSGVVMAELVHHTVADLPMVLATYLGFGPRPVDPRRTAVSIPVVAYEPVGDGAPAGAVGLLLASRQRSWRVTSLWSRDRGVVEQRSLVGFDAGPGGMWRVEAERDRMEVVPSSPSDLLRRLVDLLPRARRSGRCVQ